jgi:hypothetical protein
VIGGVAQSGRSTRRSSSRAASIGAFNIYDASAQKKSTMSSSSRTSASQSQSTSPLRPLIHESEWRKNTFRPGRSKSSKQQQHFVSHFPRREDWSLSVCKRFELRRSFEVLQAMRKQKSTRLARIRDGLPALVRRKTVCNSATPGEPVRLRVESFDIRPIQILQNDVRGPVGPFGAPQERTNGERETRD